MKKENCTKGPVKAEMSHAPNNGLQRDSYDLYGADGSCFATMRGEKKEANAELIAEAFNILHQTGMTPRELAEAVQELRGACSEALSDMQPPDEGGLTGAEHDAGGGEGTIIRLKALLSKYQPVTPEA